MHRIDNIFCIHIENSLNVAKCPDVTVPTWREVEIATEIKKHYLIPVYQEMLL